MSRVAAAVVVAVLLVACPAAAASDGVLLQTPDRFDSTTFAVTLHENGSATWAIEYAQPLDNETEVERFEDYASNFEQNETALYRNFVDDADTLTRIGTDKTGREMAARNVQRSAGVEPAQSLGTVRLSFLWTNFSRVYADRLVVSDVFDGGFYIGADQSLVFQHDTSLSFATVDPSPDSRSVPGSLTDSRSVTYDGEQSFDDSRPYVALGATAASQPTTTTAAAAGDGTGDSMWRLAIALAVLALGAVAVAAWRSGAAAAVLGDDDDAGGTAPDPVPETPVDEAELLSDDDRVLKLLEENGGRMKQVDIVETTEWSKSKVSMLLSDMEEAGHISKLRVGRENIISLVGEEPDAAGSPFDEE